MTNNPTDTASHPCEPAVSDERLAELLSNIEKHWKNRQYLLYSDECITAIAALRELQRLRGKGQNTNSHIHGIKS